MTDFSVGECTAGFKSQVFLKAAQIGHPKVEYV